MAIMSIGGLNLRPPEKKISFDTSRSVAKFEVPGYKSIYQDMGQGERTCTFNGLIDGASALDKALKLEKIKDKGEQVLLIAGPVTTKVIIEKFKFEWYRDDIVRYEMTLIRVDEITTSAQYKVSNLTKNRNAIARTASGGLAGGLAAISTISQPFVQGIDLRSVAGDVSGNVDDWQYVAALNNLDSAIVPDGVKTLLTPADAEEMESLKAVVNTVRGEIPKL